MSSCLDKNFLFIIGAPRSGTTWLQAMLGAHPAVCTTVELTLFTQYTRPWLNAWRAESGHIAAGDWHQGLPVLWTESEFQGFLQEFLDRVYKKVLETKPEATHILDKHPGYTACVAEIRWLLPRAQFIHVIRDGRDVAASLVAAQRDMGFGCRTIREAAHIWRSSIEQARSARTLAGDYLEIRYEDLLATPRSSLKTVFEFSHLPVNDQLVDSIVEHCAFDKMKQTLQSPASGIKEHPAHFRKGTTGGWKEDFRPIDRYFFHRIAGQLLSELGYIENNTGHSWWGDTPLQKLRIRGQAAIEAVFRRMRRTIVRG